MAVLPAALLRPPKVGRWGLAGGAGDTKTNDPAIARITGAFALACVVLTFGQFCCGWWEVSPSVHDGRAFAQHLFAGYGSGPGGRDYQEMDIPTRFGMTHVVVSGPKDAPPVVLLHGYRATSTMWAPNIADFSKDYRVHAVDVMGQPSKSIPAEPIRDAADYATWLTATLDALHLDNVFLVGMSFGGWLALNYAVAAPARLRKLVLLSPGGFLPMVRQFSVRGILMVAIPTRFTVNSFMRWLGFTATNARPVRELMYRGLKSFREFRRRRPVSCPRCSLTTNCA